MNPYETSPAPALERGLGILEALQQEESFSLDALAKSQQIPKASALRFLKTLEQKRYVLQLSDKTWCATARIVKTKNTNAIENIKDILNHLAQETGLSAEWYIYSDTGMVLAEQLFPEHDETRVYARKGFVRHWKPEMESVICLAMGMWKRAVRGKYFQYNNKGAQINISQQYAKQIIDKAKAQGTSFEEHFNSNGVRRHAVCVYDNKKPAGVIALAESLRPTPSENAKTIQKLFTQTLQDNKLSHLP